MLIVYEEQLMSQLDELYNPPSDSVDINAQDSVDPNPIDPLPTNTQPSDDLPSPQLGNYDLIKKGIELRNLKLNHDLEVNTKIREIIRKMKDDIFEDQKKLMEMMSSNVQALKNLSIID